MRSWLTALRIARREVRRAKGRTALVMALLGLPVAALSFAAVSYDSFRLSPGQELDRTLGAADAAVTWELDAPVVQSPDVEFSAPAQADPGVDQTRRVSQADLRAVLPPGSRVVPERSGELELRTATGIGRLAAEGADLTDPIHAGRLVLREGRAPATDAEVALTRPATDRLGAGIGQTVRAADGSGSWTVVGIVEYPARLREEAIVLRPGALPVEPVRWLVDTAAPVRWEQVRALNRRGIVVRSRAVLLDPPTDDQVYQDYQGFTSEPEGLPEEISLFAGPALLEVGLLAGAAFAVGARRRVRQLALVAVSGGRPAHLRRIVLADGLVLGLAGAAVRIGLGCLAAAVGMPLLEEHLYGRRAGGFGLPLPALAGLGGLAAGTGLLAALVPAIVAARQSVVSGLASRRGVTRSKQRWVVLGLALLGLGAGLAGLGAGQVNYGLVATGLVIGQLGLVLGTPALIGLVARAGRFLPPAPRIALRDTARHRAAAAPAITAVMAVVAGTLTIGIYLVSDLSRIRTVPGIAVGSAAVYYDLSQPGVDRSLSELHDQVVAGLAAGLPSAQLAEVWTPTCASGTEAGNFCEVTVPVPEQDACPWKSLERELTAAEQRAAAHDDRCRDTSLAHQAEFGFQIVDDGTALPGLTGISGEDLVSATAVLRSGGVVAADPRAVVDGRATVEVATYREGEVEPAGSERVTLPAHALPAGSAGTAVFLSPAAAERVGVGTHLAGVVVRQEGGLTVAEQDAANAVLRAIDPNLSLGVMADLDPGPRRLVLAAVAAGLVTLTATAVATGLAAADRRGDLATLGAVGASPWVRRWLSLSQSGVIAGLGALLGTAAGLGGGFGVLTALNQQYANTWPNPDPPYPLEVPWLALAVLLLAAPLVAMLGAGLLTRSRLPIERRP